MSRLHVEALAATLIAAAASPAAVAAGSVPIALVQAPAQRIVAMPLATACAAIAPPCDPATVAAYVARGAPNGPLYLIATDRPWMARVDAPVASGIRTKTWNFDGYVHSTPTERERTNPLLIYPALYPAGAATFAVALLSTANEGYSGGGASFRTADFVELEPDGHLAGTALRVVDAAVPFSCFKMIRACFSEQEYKTSRHCHDEWTGWLSIEGNVGPSARYVWHEEVWGQDEPKSRAWRNRTPFGRNIKSSSNPPPVPFCSGN